MKATETIFQRRTLLEQLAAHPGIGIAFAPEPDPFLESTLSPEYVEAEITVSSLSLLFSTAYSMGVEKGYSDCKRILSETSLRIGMHDTAAPDTGVENEAPQDSFSSCYNVFTTPDQD